MFLLIFSPLSEFDFSGYMAVIIKKIISPQKKLSLVIILVYENT